MEDAGIADHTVIIFSADHGDSMGSHQHFEKAGTMYEEVFRIPLIVRMPGRPAQRIDRFARLMDLMPTILELAGIEPPAGIDAMSLLPLLRGEEPARWPDSVYCEHHGEVWGYQTQRMVRTGGWKYVYNPHDLDELYDLSNDPFEMTNRISAPDAREGAGGDEGASAGLERRHGRHAPVELGCAGTSRSRFPLGRMPGMRATAVVFPAPNEVVVREVECPEPGAGDVVIRVLASWISNGDGGLVSARRAQRWRRRRGRAPRPGRFRSWRATRRSGWWSGPAPRSRIWCRASWCSPPRAAVHGMYQPRGGHVSPAVCARDQVWKLPPAVVAGGVEAAVAYSGLVLTQVGYNCGTRAALAPGETAVVIGDGLVGHWAAQTLAWRGAAVTLVGHHAARLERFQAGATLLASGAEWPQPVAAAQSGAGLRVLVDTVGSVAAIAAALPHMARDGGIVSAGFYGEEDRIGLQSLRFGEQTLYAVSGWTRPRMDRTLELIAAGAITTIPLITHRFPVSQAAAAWELINSRAEGVLGVVLDWEE